MNTTVKKNSFYSLVLKSIAKAEASGYRIQSDVFFDFHKKICSPTAAVWFSGVSKTVPVSYLQGFDSGLLCKRFSPNRYGETDANYSLGFQDAQKYGQKVHS